MCKKLDEVLYKVLNLLTLNGVNVYWMINMSCAVAFLLYGLITGGQQLISDFNCVIDGVDTKMIKSFCLNGRTSVLTNVSDHKRAGLPGISEVLKDDGVKYVPYYKYIPAILIAFTSVSLGIVIYYTQREKKLFGKSLKRAN